MPRLVVSIDGVVIKEAPLVKEHTAVGRRPYNDVVIDNLAVSGEHAVFHLTGGEVEVEDLNSTNGTYVNGKAVKRQVLRGGDTVEVGKYKIRFLNEEEAPGFEKTMLFKPGMLPLQKPAAPVSPAAPTSVVLSAAVRVLSGAAAGREVALLKVVTTVGKPGVAVASITKRHQGFVLAHDEGVDFPTLNGVPIGAEPVPLKTGDRIALAGTEMEFIQG
jgi:pSer/pThr/pTyr-binding forkhead associated (FHA) protein